MNPPIQSNPQKSPLIHQLSLSLFLSVSLSLALQQPAKPAATPMVSFFSLYRFATCSEIVFMLLGTCSSALVGMALPVFVLIFGQMLNNFVDNGKLANVLKDFDFSSYNLTIDEILRKPQVLDKVFKNCTFIPDINGTLVNCTLLEEEVRDLLGQGILDAMTDNAYKYLVLAGIMFFVGYFQMAFFQHAAERQVASIRRRFLASILRQNIAWFDETPTGELSTRLTDDVLKIREGIGNKLGTLLQTVMQSMAGIGVAFYFSWKLTLVILAASPLLVVCGFVMGKLMASFTSQESGAYAKAGAVAEQAISCIRTVAAFGGQDKEAARYEVMLKQAEKKGIVKAFISGFSVGVTMVCIFGTYALAFWYGSLMVRNKEIEAGDLVTVFFSVLVAAFSFGSAGPTIGEVASARGAAHKIYEIIDRKPEIDGVDATPSSPISRFSGDVRFSSVRFSYPTRRRVPVLRDLTLSARPGRCVALVGSSGCGKSTALQLLMRFYDVDGGAVEVDGRDVRDMDLRSLRQNIGLVGQEPVLFATTIEANIRLGKPEATMDEIKMAAKAANAHDFVSRLPKKYETIVGERGAQLSGGQKQRIAIARALIRNPSILLLDEATSALDLESESVVQEALQKAQEGRTTIVIAHRLSTIINADVIFVLESGRVVETGRHEELMAKRGVYHKLVESQTFRQDSSEPSSPQPVDLNFDEVFRAHDDDDDDDDKNDDEAKARKRRTSSFKRTISKAKRSLGETMTRSLSSGLGYKDLDGAAEKLDADKPPPASLWRIYKMNRPEWGFIFFGILGSIILGGTSPVFAIIFSEVLSVFQNTDVAQSESESLFWSLMFLSVGGAHLVGHLLSTGLFGVAGEKLTTRLRRKSFKSILQQETAFFDDKANSTGALCARLAADATQVKGAVGQQLGFMMQQVVNVAASLAIAFYSGWELTLVILAFAPFLVAAGAMRAKFMTSRNKEDKKSLEKATEAAVEAIENIRTVASLGREAHFYRKYDEGITEIADNAVKSSHVMGLSQGFSQCIIYFAYAGAFTFGAYLIQNGQSNFNELMRVFGCVVFGAMAVGQISSFAPDFAKARQASGWIFALIDRKSRIEIDAPEGKRLTSPSGRLTLDSVNFSYPSRPTVAVLRGLTLAAEPRQRVAVVGGSGCGKSTVVQLLLRLYDPDGGKVAFDDEALEGLNLKWMRSLVGLVAQEPVLFDCSIAENISYGLESNDAEDENDAGHAHSAAIVEAARQANIHEFISGLPLGYETRVGEKGAQLSGGQKQRVAIARALIRNPKVLLLDEATSALDNESEALVQSALDSAQSGRTSIVVAHRLSTIKDADVILVVKDGVVVESGRHAELMRAKGHYFKLQSANVTL